MEAAIRPTESLETTPMRRADVDLVVAIHLMAFRGFFLSFLGRRFLRLFYAEAIALGEIAVTVRASGRPIGFVMGSSSPGRFFKALVRRRAVGFALAAAPRVLRHPGTAMRVARALLKASQAARPDGTATLMSLAVDPSAQGCGAGTTLVLAFIDEARRRGAVRVDLTTDKIDNDRTNAFYRSVGFDLLREIVTPERRILNEYAVDL